MKIVDAAVRREALEELRLLDVKDAAQLDPKALINEIKFFDPAQAADEDPQLVEFKMFPPEGWQPPTEDSDGEWRFHTKGTHDWFWQSLIVDWWNDEQIKKYLILKARQLGITLLACAYALWLMLFRPGSTSVAYSYTEDEAKKLLDASWAMFQALPDILKNHVEVVTPKRTELASEWIRLRHKNGQLASFQALPATRKHGHGARVTFGIMDEAGRQDYAREIYTAINPATSRGRAKLVIISTANGRSNPETGEGNFFHHLYENRREYKLAFKFLPWNLEPSRDEAWYQSEAIKLPEVERNQQYPLNESDAFRLSGALYFDSRDLDFYSENSIYPTLTGQFYLVGRREAEFRKSSEGFIEVLERPKTNTKYAIGIDTSTGRGKDYTSGDVIDLSSGAIVACFRAKMEAPLAAIQFHYLGKWYNGAKLGIERQGGYGESLIYALRDGHDNLPPYTNFYRHKAFTKTDKDYTEQIGHPMGTGSRQTVLEGLKTALHFRQFPWLTHGHVNELASFVYQDTGTSPRAMDGCNDDRVMSLALANEMYRQFGERANPKRRWRKRKYVPPPTRSGVYA